MPFRPHQPGGGHARNSDDERHADCENIHGDSLFQEISAKTRRPRGDRHATGGLFVAARDWRDAARSLMYSGLAGMGWLDSRRLA
jgi:hypothetical protein